jgi:hypothetical protein
MHRPLRSLVVEQATLDGLQCLGSAVELDRGGFQEWRGSIVFDPKQHQPALEAARQPRIHVFHGAVAHGEEHRIESLPVMVIDVSELPDGTTRASFVATGPPRPG